MQASYTQSHEITSETLSREETGDTEKEPLSLYLSLSFSVWMRFQIYTN